VAKPKRKKKKKKKKKKCSVWLFVSDGVILAADTLGSYGSTAMFTNLQRLIQIGEHTVIGGGGLGFRILL
jgi:20S proteasome alpha/beta subunit